MLTWINVSWVKRMQKATPSRSARVGYQIPHAFLMHYVKGVEEDMDGVTVMESGEDINHAMGR